MVLPYEAQLTQDGEVIARAVHPRELPELVYCGFGEVPFIVYTTDTNGRYEVTRLVGAPDRV